MPGRYQSLGVGRLIRPNCAMYCYVAVIICQWWQEQMHQILPQI